MAARRPRARRGPRVAHLRRWLAVGVVGIVAFLYYRPLTHYVEARGDVARADAHVRELEASHAQLKRQLAAQTSTEALIREARRLAYVQPGERLFIVKGIPEWREARRVRIGGDG
ncbi:MAG: septum formation initiator family protein [Thermoleophilia bacterium]|nr:septum formation initiator family protein [Thermoleophilia bacterium]